MDKLKDFKVTFVANGKKEILYFDDFLDSLQFVTSKSLRLISISGDIPDRVVIDFKYRK